jgi:hypothetical protein
MASLHELIGIAEISRDRAVADRCDPEGPLHVATLALLSEAIGQAKCIAAAIDAGCARSAWPNLRALFEIMVTFQYLAAPSITRDVRDSRLERYFRGVRQAQVRWRAALSEHPAMAAVLIRDPALVESERSELEAYEAELPKAQRLGKHWSGEAGGLRGMAESVGLGSDYAMLYRMTSGLAHGSRPWDTVIFDSSLPIVVPRSGPDNGLARPLAFDAVRLLGWLLATAHQLGIAILYRTEQSALQDIVKYYKPLDVLYRDGLVGADGPVDAG